MAQRRRSYSASSNSSWFSPLMAGLFKGMILGAIIWCAFWVGAHFSTHQQLNCDTSNSKKNIALIQALATSNNKENAITELFKREQAKANQLETQLKKTNTISAYALSPIEGVKKLQQTCPGQ